MKEERLSLQELFSHPLWGLLLEEIESWRTELLERLGTAKSWEEVCSLQGQLKLLSRLLTLPRNR